MLNIDIDIPWHMLTRLKWYFSITYFARDVKYVWTSSTSFPQNRKTHVFPFWANFLGSQTFLVLTVVALLAQAVTLICFLFLADFRGWNFFVFDAGLIVGPVSHSIPFFADSWGLKLFWLKLWLHCWPRQSTQSVFSSLTFFEGLKLFVLYCVGPGSRPLYLVWNFLSPVICFSETFFFVWNCGRIVGPGSHPLYCLLAQAIASYWNNASDFIFFGHLVNSHTQEP